MKAIALVIIMSLASLFISSCQAPTEAPTAPAPTPPAKETPEEITETPISPQTKAGLVEHDETWSGEILITDYVEVPVGVTLTVLPGTVVKFKHWRHGYTALPKRLGMFIFGELKAVGTPDKLITFTSDAPDPRRRDWEDIGIKIKGDQARATIRYAVVEFGTLSAEEGAHLEISDSTLRNTWGAGVFFMGQGATGVVKRCRIYGHAHNGIELEDHATAEIKYSEIARNTGGLGISDGSHAIIEHNIIDNNKVAGIGVQGSKAEIRYNTIRGNSWDGEAGVVFHGAGVVAEITHNTITKNFGYGVHDKRYDADSPSNVSYNNIYNNTQYELCVQGSLNLDADNNFWGTVDEAEVADKVFDGNDNTQFGTATYSPYLRSRVDGEITTHLSFDYPDVAAHPQPEPGSPEDPYPYVLPDDESRKTVARVFEGHRLPTGLAWDGENLWVSTQLYEIYKIDVEGDEVIKKFKSPGWPFGLAWDGENLWVSGYTKGMIYELDTEGNTISQFQAPTGMPSGLAWDGQYLWISGNLDPYLYKMDREGNLISKIEVFPEPYSYRGGSYGAGLAFDGEYLWVEVAGDYRIYKVHPETGELLGAITTPGDSTHDMAWAEGFLWCADWTYESREAAKVFKLRILSPFPP